MTPEDVDQRSQLRARRNTRRLAVIGLFVVACFLVLAGLLQVQQDRMKQLVAAQGAQQEQMCEQRRANALRTNATWDALAETDRHNPNLDPMILEELLRIYSAAKLTVPVCQVPLGG